VFGLAGAVMDPIAQAAGTALVQATVTDAWQQVKRAVVALWRRARPESARRVGGDLDELRAQVLQARADGDAGAEQALEGAWRLRLEELLRADPALADDLRQVLDQVLVPVLPADGRTRIETIVMTGSSRDSSTFTQIGSQVNHGRP
jgi:hypothetical protein